MKKIAILLTLVVTFFTFQSCKKINGDGPVVTEMRSVSGFSSVRTGIDGDIYFTPGNSYRVEIRAQQNILAVLNTKVNGSELVVDYDYNKNIGRHERVQIYITAPNINGLTASGSGDLNVTGTLRASSINFRVSGSGSMSIPEVIADNIHSTISGSGAITINNGSALAVTTEISGSGRIDMLGVIARNAYTRTSGSGTTKVYATDNLEATISGSGNVYYRGNPHVSTSISGSGNVRPW